MNKLYRDYLLVPKRSEGKISEKVLMTRITLTVVFIILCLAQLGIAAFAHFSSNVSASGVLLRTAKYDVDWKITINNETTMNGSIVCTEEDSFPKEYTITLSLGSENTADTGFGIVKVDFTTVEGRSATDDTPDLVYHTSQIGKDIKADHGSRDSITFTLVLNSPAVVTFLSSWGTSSSYCEYENKNDEFYIENGETINVTRPNGTGISTEPPGDDNIYTESTSEETTAALETTAAPETTSEISAV